MISSVLAIKILFAAGVTNVVLAVVIFFSCRCLMGPRLGGYLSRFGWFNKFYRYHCYYWWAFLASVLLHAWLAFYLF